MRKAKGKQKTKSPSLSNINTLENNNINIDSIGSSVGYENNNINQLSSDKTESLNSDPPENHLPDTCEPEEEESQELTDQEKAFLEHYFKTSDLEGSVKFAKIPHASPAGARTIGNRILHRYCANTEDKVKILREIGWSEVTVVLQVAHLAETAKGENIRLNALKVLANIHGLLAREDELPPSVPIRMVFTDGEDQDQAEGRQLPQDQAQGKPVSIVR
jgi:hypothetical protein